MTKLSLTYKYNNDNIQANMTKITQQTEDIFLPSFLPLSLSP